MNTTHDIENHTEGMAPVTGALGAKAYDVTLRGDERPVWVVADGSGWLDGTYPTAEAALAAAGDFPKPTTREEALSRADQLLFDPGYSGRVVLAVGLICASVGAWLGAGL